MTDEKYSVRNIFLFAMLLCGATTFIIFVVSVIAWMFLRDPILISASGRKYVPSEALIKMLCYILFIAILFIYIPLRLKIHEKIISKKSGIVVVTILTYLLSCASLAVFLSFSTQLVNYEEISDENPHRDELLENGIPCYFDLKESFFDAVSGFTTTGLTAFKTKYVDSDGIEREIRKIDVQPRLIHIIRATYLWIGGLGIMFFYLYFTPVPSLMMSMGYEIPTERSLPRFIRLEGLSLFLVYAVITSLGIFFLFLSVSSACQYKIDSVTAMTYSVVLAFSSISTGGFSPGEGPVNELGIEQCSIVTYWGFVVIMVLMLAGAMPIFSLHRPMRFLRRWMIFAMFVLPIFIVAALSYSDDRPEVSLYRSFDAISAFTTTGLSTSQFVEDFEMPSEFEYEHRLEKNTVAEIYRYRIRNVYTIVLMFIGGAGYSTAGGWGFFNVFTIIYILYLILTGKMRTLHLIGSEKSRRGVNRVVLALFLSFIIFFSIFIIGTILLYTSGLFGLFSGPEPAAVTDYVINSAFYEISALSTVGLTPEYMLLNGSIYYNNLAYWTLTVSMLIGRIYYIIFPFLFSLIISEEGT